VEPGTETSDWHPIPAPGESRHIASELPVRLAIRLNNA
jgi:hypothetical protein